MTEVAVVTGTSSGMGLHAAVELARRGMTVVATVREPGRADRLLAEAERAGVAVDVRALEVTDREAGTALVAGVLADHGHIDVLVNNAGRGAVGTAEQLTMAEIEAQMELNYLAPVHLTKAVLPAMRAAGRGRVLTVTSVGGAVGQPFADAYCGAKFAVEGFMQSLAPVAERFGVWVSVIEPAAVASEFTTNAARPEVVDGDPYTPYLVGYLSRTAGAFAAAQPASRAGAAIADAATSAEYRFRWQTSDVARQFVSASLADVDGARVLGFTRSWIDSPASAEAAAPGRPEEPAPGGAG
ncbi:SDR family NAD(P)-dependent oxidoreductase [Tsukamurella soli]|uniref:SDR family NAD(P)-dependent oxidoreductase n=1 Tax=Tsukamurella soli TaxID=644556 RepID=UPI0031E4EC54